MVSKTSSVRSIRLQNEVWARLGEHAEKRGVNVNAAVAELIEQGLAGATKPMPGADQILTPLRKAEAKTARVFKSRLKGEWKAP